MFDTPVGGAFLLAVLFFTGIPLYFFYLYIKARIEGKPFGDGIPNKYERFNEYLSDLEAWCVSRELYGVPKEGDFPNWWDDKYVLRHYDVIKSHNSKWNLTPGQEIRYHDLWHRAYHLLPGKEEK